MATLPGIPYEKKYLGKLYTDPSIKPIKGDVGNRDSISELAYQNYFFSGNDITVGLVPFYPNDNKKIILLPVTDMMFGMSQEKVPIFSAFSYKWDAIAKGTKIVRGEFSIVFSKPNFIGRLLGRPEDPDIPVIPGTSSNPVVEVSGDTLVDKKVLLKSQFWDVANSEATQIGNSIITNTNDVFNVSDKSAFPFGREPFGKQWDSEAGQFEGDYAGHQPFDLIIIMGTTVSYNRRENSGFDGYGSWSESIVEDNVYTDFNEKSHSATEKIILKNVELMSCGIGMDPSGQPLRESYSFISRDAIIG